MTSPNRSFASYSRSKSDIAFTTKTSPSVSNLAETINQELSPNLLFWQCLKTSKSLIMKKRL